MIKVEMKFLGGVYFHKTTFPKDFIGAKEIHPYEHGSICAQGSGFLLRGEEQIPFKAGDIVDVKAEIPHTVVTCEETIWICAHAEGA